MQLEKREDAEPIGMGGGTDSILLLLQLARSSLYLLHDSLWRPVVRE
jgi:hypothetical protein